MSEHPTTEDRTDTPQLTLEGMRKNLPADLLSGFLVFLIALPLCLGISIASGYPPIAGIFTAIIGGVLCPLISNSELTIKGPAAGLIVIAVGAVTDLGGGSQGYHLALGIGVAAGLAQIALGVFRVGVLGEFFPTAAVHGMLAAIGVIIAGKQIHTLVGVKLDSKITEPLKQIAEIPHSVMNLNPEVACIGVVSLLILFGLPLFKNKTIKMIPAPMLVLLVAIPLEMYFDLEDEHIYEFQHHLYNIGPSFLVDLPSNMFQAITRPDFSALFTGTGIKYFTMFTLVGALESLLSAKAINLLDPWRRKSNLNRDLIAIGVANSVAAFVGGLPMISEIARSSANVNNGARTRFANMFHGLFLLLFVALVPGLIHRIPLAALSAMLIAVGYRLASPRAFMHTLAIGREQLVVFVSTLVGVLATDLLIGIGIGIAVEMLIHVINGVPLRKLFTQDILVERVDDKKYILTVHDAAVFSSWLAFKKQIQNLGAVEELTLDLSRSHLVDHTVMAKLHEMESEFARSGAKLRIIGLDDHRAFSDHPFAARKKLVET